MFATVTSRSCGILPIMLTRTRYFPEGALGIINTPFSSVVVPMGSGAPVSGFTRTTVA